MTRACSIQLELNIQQLQENVSEYTDTLFKVLSEFRFSKVIFSVKANESEKLICRLRNYVKRENKNVVIAPWYSFSENADPLLYYVNFVNSGADFLLVDEMCSEKQVFSELPSSSILKLSEIEKLNSTNPKRKDKAKSRKTKRKNMAMFTPLPPMKSGIAGYSKDLYSSLKDFYNIDVFVPDTDFSDIRSHCKKISVKKLSDFHGKSGQYERLLFHFGNNPMHVDFFELLALYGGVAVLHDFYLSGVQWYRQAHNFKPGALDIALYQSHGLAAVAERSQIGDQDIVAKYPCNFEVLKNADGIITHSEYSEQLLNSSYNCSVTSFHIPLMRQRRGENITRREARSRLGIDDNTFLVCSFGFTGPTKLNKELIFAWLESDIPRTASAKLVLVGENEDGPYGKELTKLVNKYDGKIEITGWTESDQYQRYLAAADVAVQLRSLSRGETSAAVLDTMIEGIPTIVNANGSFSYLPKDAVVMLKDTFTESELTDALNALFASKSLREQISKTAIDHLTSYHNPSFCAAEYHEAIENVYGNRVTKSQLAKQVFMESRIAGQQDFLDIAASFVFSNPAKVPKYRLLLDVSVVAEDDFKTGIQRVVREISSHLINFPPEGFRIELVKLKEFDGQWKYVFARDYAKKIAGIDEYTVIGYESEVLPTPGDVFIGLDLAGGYVVNAARQGYFDMLRCFGAKVVFVVYDLIPLQFENIYPPGFKEGHEQWLEVVKRCDGAICISETVANDLQEWVGECSLPTAFFHLGCDIVNHTSTKGIPDSAKIILQELEFSTNFLMVGTIEPRKGYGFVLKAMEQCWQNGGTEKLIIVGKQGWMVEKLVQQIRESKEYGHKLLWLEGVSDEFLEQIYAKSDCLIAASEGEGFGLPLIEASLKGIPILARDIKVFREVAGNFAHYFDGDEPNSLTKEIENWLKLYKESRHIESVGMPKLSWRQSGEKFKKALNALLS